VAKPGRKWRRALEWSLLVPALAGAIYLRACVLMSGCVVSRSMEPTLHVDDYFLIDRLAYKHRLPAPGDIVAFHTLDRKQVWVKRAVAGPGDTVELRAGVLYRNGRVVREPHIRQRLRLSFPLTQVPQDEVFVLGDNRDNSDDSRNWGPLHHDYMIGRAFFIYWPRARTGRLH